MCKTGIIIRRGLSLSRWPVLCWTAGRSKSHNRFSTRFPMVAFISVLFHEPQLKPNNRKKKKNNWQDEVPEELRMVNPKPQEITFKNTSKGSGWSRFASCLWVGNQLGGYHDAFRHGKKLCWLYFVWIWLDLFIDSKYEIHQKMGSQQIYPIPL